MFGYIVVNKAELKFKEFDVYQSYYCGLCRAIKKQNGNLSRLSLSYDMTFIYMLLSALYEPKTECHDCKCVFHPLEKRMLRTNEIADYVADMSVLMTCYKCQDDWRDDKKLSRKMLFHLIDANNGERILERYREKVERIADLMDQINKGEQAGSTDIDFMSGLFGRIMAELFIYQEDEWETILAKMGFYMGKFIYLIDAYEDMEEDTKKKKYNPLRKLYETPDFEGECQQILTMMIAECAKEFEKLPIIEHADILRNILYSGVWVKYEMIRTKRAEQNTGMEKESHE